MSRVRESYDAVAEAYAAAVAPVQDKPFDLDALARFAGSLSGREVADVGCGPGDVTAWLAERGLDAVGIDGSPGMVETARRLRPGLRFEVGDLLHLPRARFDGITAFYCLIHLPEGGLLQGMRALHAALRPGGALLVALHEGDQAIELEEWFGQAVELTTRFHRAEAVRSALTEAGFETAWLETRPPYPDIEFPSNRVYALGRRA